MRKLFTLCLLVFSLSASAQWQQTGSKVRYVNGLGIPTRDTAAGVAADSSQILIRPADSSLYVKYKRTWVKVGGGTVSGTPNRVSKFTGATTLGNSSIVDSASAVAMTINPSGNIGIGTITPNQRLDLRGASGLGLQIYETSSGNDNRLILSQTGTESRFTSTFNTGAGLFTWVIGGGEVMRITSGGNVGINQNAPAGRFVVADGQTLLGTNTNNGVDRLQVSGSMNVSATATAQNLSVTNNISVTNDINQGSGTASTNYTILANGTSSGWAGQMRGNYSTGQFEFYHRNNSPTFTLCFAVNANGAKGNTSFYDNAFIQGDGWLTVNGSTNNGVDKLQVVGSASITGMKQAYLARTTAYTATTSDYLIDCTTGTFTVTLFAASGNAGRIIMVKNSGTGTITVDANASETIDGATTYSLSAQYATVQLMCDGTNWKIISKF